jgi:shikimate dehydrogenase
LVIDYLDSLDPISNKTNSVNTITNQNNRLVGYNTDVYGIEKAIANLNIKSALIFGYGSVANSLVYVLKKMNLNSIHIIGKNIVSAQLRANELGVDFLDKDHKFDLLINATPSGGVAGDAILEYLKYTNILFNLPVLQKQNLLELKTSDHEIKLISGIEMSKWQLQKQFYLYTHLEVDIEIINVIIKDKYYL